MPQNLRAFACALRWYESLDVDDVLKLMLSAGQTAFKTVGKTFASAAKNINAHPSVLAP